LLSAERNVNLKSSENQPVHSLDVQCLDQQEEIGHDETAVMDVLSIAGPMLRENKMPSTRNIYRELSYLYLFQRSPQHQHQWRRENHNWDRTHAKPPMPFTKPIYSILAPSLQPEKKGSLAQRVERQLNRKRC